MRNPLYRLGSLIAASILGLALLGCSPKASFTNVDITGSTAFGKEFSLLDPDDKTRTLEDFKGKVVVMFFGYTQCPDVCPTTLTEMEQAMNLLGPQSNQVQVLFVTVDPQRDTAAILKQYVPAFDPRFLGLRPADDAALEKVTKDFKIYYKKVPGSSPGSYTIDHTAGSYAFDRNGQLRLFIKHAQGPQTLAQDLKELLKQ
ncbi:SCO family protein [Polynucleobacter sphagniphilus]|jgi:protein SCO1/2|uniref:SCO family protein n=1 Tax=Polynucleobacter sphagniphilus TaxID=1743169 RepID=UPI00096BA1AA|nr:SCO family protein [Polynucleobacter sphagniphilus]MDF9788565.1 protein SCO1/2 [Polynucleobacter sphagniphilus]MDH6155144.1 protein SCO1/2 [Polynucleobacter sphagniphilus]MDH6241732.1 protein SCO1/2 [Polynucleobacter sphagniphilus]MDH6299656.1 protein SCO1/2 [Polynucleobacter sphagniphilus]MDH6301381.1 protein SCO1/2 [Polynucleobacter sphagniphilus]